MMKMEIIKQRVNTATRQLSARWTFEPDFEEVRKKPETEEEEAEEIIHRLKAPPRKKRNRSDFEDSIATDLAMAITAEIDREIMTSYGQRNN